MEAIQVKLTGDISNYYDVYYRAHISDFGWLGWTKNGETAGSEGCSIPMEAIEIKLCPKNKSTIKTSQSYIKNPTLTYKTHVSNLGWQKEVTEGKLAGTTGKALQVEALVIQCKDFFGGNGIKYRAHVENVGWQNWVKGGQTAGTTGKNQQIEAVEIKLDGQLANYFDIQYRVHCEDYGWLEWVANGKMAGTTGKNKQVEAIEIKLISKEKKQSGTSVSDKGGTYAQPIVLAGAKWSNNTTNNAGCRHDVQHKDIGGVPVYAIADGTIVCEQRLGQSGAAKNKLVSYGNVITFISKDGKTKAIYAHLSKFEKCTAKVTASATFPCGVDDVGTPYASNCGTFEVKRGEVIGYVGTTGNSTGDHLHFELYINGQRKDPVKYVGIN